MIEEQPEANLDRQKAQQWLDELQKPVQSGGYNLPDTDVRVVRQREVVEELTATYQRLLDQYERAIIERQEASLSGKARTRDCPIEHRAECHPLAILGGQLRTIPAGAPSRGTSPEHAYDIVGGRNW